VLDYKELGLEEGCHAGAFAVGINANKTKILLDVYPKYVADDRIGMTKTETVILINYLLKNLLEIK
jgi:hypothetical protein